MFTPLESGIGALLIQFASSSYIYNVGQPVGFSSIIYNAFVLRSAQSISVVLGMITAGVFASIYLPQFIPHITTNRINLSPSWYISLAGLLVGLGTSYGSGCTSGHMIGGLSRLRLRSLVATGAFFITSLAAAYFIHEPTSCNTPEGAAIACYIIETSFPLYNSSKAILSTLLVTSHATSYVILPLISNFFKDSSARTKSTVKLFAGFNSGLWFGLGLCISGMINPEKVLGFLLFTKPQYFDPSLAMIVLFAIIPNILMWNYFKPLPQNVHEIDTIKTNLNEPYNMNFSNNITPKFLFGNILFGLGWGMLDVCPGPGIINLITVGSNGFLWMCSFLVGYWLTKAQFTK